MPKKIIFKLYNLPRYVKVYTSKNYFKYNYLFFFSKKGFLKYKFNRSEMLIDSQKGKLKISGYNYSLYNTYKTIINTLISSVAFGFVKHLTLNGLGLKYRSKKNFFYLILGYSHLVKIKIPQNIKISHKKKSFFLESHDSMLLNDFIIKLKRFKPVDVYKGKGIRINGEKYIIKKGKQSSY